MLSFAANQPTTPHSLYVEYGQGDMYNVTWSFDGKTVSGKVPPNGSVKFKVSYRKSGDEKEQHYKEVRSFLKS